MQKRVVVKQIPFLTHVICWLWTFHTGQRPSSFVNDRHSVQGRGRSEEYDANHELMRCGTNWQKALHSFLLAFLPSTQMHDPEYGNINTQVGLNNDPSTIQGAAAIGAQHDELLRFPIFWRPAQGDFSKGIMGRSSTTITLKHHSFRHAYYI